MSDTENPELQEKNRQGPGSESTWFRPGQSGNPNGRPKKADTFSDIARTLLSAKEIHIEYSYPKAGKLINSKLNITSDNTINHSLVAALVKEGMDGNVNAIKELIDRTEGRALQMVNLGGQKDDPMDVYTDEEKAAMADALDMLKGGRSDPPPQS